MHFPELGYVCGVLNFNSSQFDWANKAELSLVLRHDCPTLEGNESCSSFQGRGVGVMRFLPCVCRLCIQASADVPAFVHVSCCFHISEGRFDISANWEQFWLISCTDGVRGEYLDTDEKLS